MSIWRVDSWGRSKKNQTINQLLRETMTKAHLNTALVALAAYAIVALVQSKFEIPVVGAYLPKA